MSTSILTLGIFTNTSWSCFIRREKAIQRLNSTEKWAFLNFYTNQKEERVGFDGPDPTVLGFFIISLRPLFVFPFTFFVFFWEGCFLLLIYLLLSIENKARGNTIGGTLLQLGAPPVLSLRVEPNISLLRYLL